MTKFVFIADTHLIHRYIKEYDKIIELKRLVSQIMKEKPDAIIVLGDFFDKKISNQGNVITHPEGATFQIPVEEIIEATKVNWYALVGNHEDEIVLKSISRGARNFFICRTIPEMFDKEGAKIEDLPLELGNFNFWFCNLDVDAKKEEKDKVLRSFSRAAKGYTRNKKENILLTHLDFIPRGGGVGLEKSLLIVLSDAFKFVLNGHEHTYELSVQGLKNIKCVPASLPPEIKKGSNLIVKFEFKDKLKKVKEFEEPFGYLVLNDTNNIIEFKNFIPKVPTIEIHYDVTDKDLSQLDLDWENIVESLKKIFITEKKYEAVVVIPVFNGLMKDILNYQIDNSLEEISNKSGNIYIDHMREGDNLKIPSYNVEDIKENTVLNLESLFKIVYSQVEDIEKRLKDKGIEVDKENLISIISKMESLDKVFFSTQKKNRSEYMSGILNSVINELNSTFNTKWKEREITQLMNEIF